MSTKSMDTITILKSAGPKLTKTFDGEQVRPYDQAKQFQVSEAQVANIHELSGVLSSLEKKVTRCVIRGKFVGEDKAVAKGDKPGYFLRVSPNFEQVARHWAMFDIDRYWPVIYDRPAETPEESIQEFIRDQLPLEFQEASYYWQLSSSAGMKDPGCLKAHIWFWFEKAYTGDQLEAWIRTNSLPVDVAPMRTIQVHFVSNPQFINGAVDPVAVRSGLYIGMLGDSVPLEIPEDVLAGVDSHENVAGDDLDLTDPTTKPGLIGAFCRAYPISRVLGEILPEEFEYAVGNDRRVTWLNSGGGSPEGCFVREDDLYFGNTHHSDPFENRLTNAWDLVRHFKFGDMDGDLAKDPLVSVNELPSHRAMLAWVETLDDVRDEQVAVATDARDLAVAAIRGAQSEADLKSSVLPKVMAGKKQLAQSDLAILAGEVQRKMQALTGSKVTIATARTVLREADKKIREGSSTDLGRGMPSWAQPWVYVTNGDTFFNLDSKERRTRQGFDFAFQRFMGPYMDEFGNVPSPSELAASLWAMDVVANVAYNPPAGRVFEMGGLQYANTYSALSIPEVPPVLTAAEQKLVTALEAHASKLLPDERERTLFLDWLAFNVQNPGVKIRWSPFLYGPPGVGKSLWHSVLQAAMGQKNVAVLSSETLLTSPFNSWANEAAVVTIEEIKVPEHSAREAENKLKEPVSNPEVQIHIKGKSPYNVPNVTNYLILSNFADGLPVSEEDRRYMVLATVMSSAEAAELGRSGYFKELFGGLYSFPGAVRGWLLNRRLSAEFEPDGRAPITSARDQAIQMAKSDTRSALDEILEAGAKGVTRDYISSAHLALAIRERLGREVRTKSVQSILSTAGYALYPRKVKWDGQARSVWVIANRLAIANPTAGGLEDKNQEIRKALDASAASDFDFLA